MLRSRSTEMTQPRSDQTTSQHISSDGMAAGTSDESDLDKHIADLHSKLLKKNEKEDGELTADDSRPPSVNKLYVDVYGPLESRGKPARVSSSRSGDLHSRHRNERRVASYAPEKKRRHSRSGSRPSDRKRNREREERNTRGKVLSPKKTTSYSSRADDYTHVLTPPPPFPSLNQTTDNWEVVDMDVVDGESNTATPPPTNEASQMKPQALREKLDKLVEEDKVTTKAQSSFSLVDEFGCGSLSEKEQQVAILTARHNEIEVSISKHYDHIKRIHQKAYMYQTLLKECKAEISNTCGLLKQGAAEQKHISIKLNTLRSELADEFQNQNLDDIVYDSAHFKFDNDVPYVAQEIKSATVNSGEDVNMHEVEEVVEREEVDGMTMSPSASEDNSPQEQSLNDYRSPEPQTKTEEELREALIRAHNEKKKKEMLKKAAVSNDEVKKFLYGGNFESSYLCYNELIDGCESANCKRNHLEKFEVYEESVVRHLLQHYYNYPLEDIGYDEAIEQMFSVRDKYTSFKNFISTVNVMMTIPQKIKLQSRLKSS